LLCNVLTFGVFVDFSKAVGSVAIFMLSGNFKTLWWTNEEEKALLRACHKNERLYQGQLKTMDAIAKFRVELAVRDRMIWL
jgi:hypothetical protein